MATSYVVYVVGRKSRKVLRAIRVESLRTAKYLQDAFVFYRRYDAGFATERAFKELCPHITIHAPMPFNMSLMLRRLRKAMHDLPRPIGKRGQRKARGL